MDLHRSEILSFLLQIYQHSVIKNLYNQHLLTITMSIPLEITRILSDKASQAQLQLILLVIRDKSKNKMNIKVDLMDIDCIRNLVMRNIFDFTIY